MHVSAYVPCYNNASTVVRAIASLRRQTVPVAELFVVDDGSSDGSAELCQRENVKVIRHQTNLGRGAVRSRAMQEAKHELVLCCDATNELAPDFTERALDWFEEPKVAAVFGLIGDMDPVGAVARWRARHLFKTNVLFRVMHHVSLITFGAMVRADAVRIVGGYNPALRHSEDGDLGSRLLASGFDVVGDPSMRVRSKVRNTLGQTFERYWRWHAGTSAHWSIRRYLDEIAYSISGMARADLVNRDPLGIPLSLICPHYCFLKSIRHRLKRELPER